jgi:hypothetical protein
MQPDDPHFPNLPLKKAQNRPDNFPAGGKGVIFIFYFKIHMNENTKLYKLFHERANIYLYTVSIIVTLNLYQVNL